MISFRDSVCLRVWAANIMGCNFFLSKEKSLENMKRYKLLLNIRISLTSAKCDLTWCVTNFLKASFVTGFCVRINSASGRLYFDRIRDTLCGQYRSLSVVSRSKWSSNSEHGPGLLHILCRRARTLRW